MNLPDLPVTAVLGDLLQALRSRHEAILQAEPGAGKTTLVPLALLDQPWLASQKILMLEPRRLAARGAAERMASLLGEPVGQTVGYRMRLDTRTSPGTRIEVITEGVLTRMLQADPSLEGVGLVIFDEFHERNLDADLGLALCLQGRRWFRRPEEGVPPLKLLLMSATLDGDRMSRMLAAEAVPAPLIVSAGRQFPVTVHYLPGRSAQEPVTAAVARAVALAVRAETGSVLAFLPGQGEIRAVLETLSHALPDHGSVQLAPLYGDLSLAEQRRAIAAPEPGQRKVVLATNIAESSLTIEGVSVVVDAGLERVPMFDPGTGMTRLSTRRISKASSIQRMGRAGRLQAGVCYRLWSEHQQGTLKPFTAPEILHADLAPLALQLVLWGVSDPLELDWLDAPPAAPFQQALDVLASVHAIVRSDVGTWSVTEHGRAMARVPAHPRLAHMLLVGVRHGLSGLACDLAALLSDRDPLPRDAGANLAERLDWLRSSAQGQASRLRQQSSLFARFGVGIGQAQTTVDPEHALGFLLASAYPDRIGKRHERHGGTANSGPDREFLLSNGRLATLPLFDRLADEEWLAVAQLGAREGESRDRIWLAAPLHASLFDGALTFLLQTVEQVDWDKVRERFRAERQRRIGCLVLDRELLADVAPETRCDVLAGVVRKRGLALLPWTDSLRQWQARVDLLRAVEGADGGWPDLSDAHLLATLEDWLGPHLGGIRHIDDFACLDLDRILRTQLPWPLPKRLDEEAPETVRVPSGSSLRIDYTVSPPVLAARVQELFGCAQTPAIAQGKVVLQLHLLSPAQRPLAVTQDLASFWHNAWSEVKKEFKGRYPKHHWPDDPLQAEATARAKPRK